jgi:threonine synthase
VGYALGLECVNCKAKYALGKMFEGCPKCRNDKFISNLTVYYDYTKIANVLSHKKLLKRPPGVWKYSELLPVEKSSHVISLKEGGTPLLKCTKIAEWIGIRELYIKDETRNPTWSFKDRFCTVAIGVALDFNATTVTASSSGNHGASTAAYSSKAGLNCVIFTMSYAPISFITFMQVYGAKVVPVTSAVGRWVLMERAVKELGWYPMNSYTLPMPTGNPYGCEGYKTIAYEILEELNWVPPDKVIVPFGAGDGLFGIWKGFWEFENIGFSNGIPSMIAAESSAGGPLTNALKKGLNYIERVEVKPTVAFSIASGTASYQSLKAVRESNGLAVMVSDEDLLNAQLQLAKMEGIYVEASSAASIAAAKKLVDDNIIESDETIVCVVTSGGLKDPEASRKALPKLNPIDPLWEKFIKVINFTGKME